MKHYHKLGFVLLSSLLVLLMSGATEASANAKLKFQPNRSAVQLGAKAGRRHRILKRTPRRPIKRRHRIYRRRTRVTLHNRKRGRNLNHHRKINRHCKPIRKPRRRINRHRSAGRSYVIRNRDVYLISTLPYGSHHKKGPILQKAQSMVVDPSGKSALIGYIGHNKRNDQEANVALRHGHAAIIWNSQHNHKFNLWDRRYSRKLGHMQSVTNYKNELAILNDPMGTITRGRIFLFNTRTLKPVRAYRIHVKNQHLGDSLAYDEHNKSFYDAYNSDNDIVVDKGSIQKHHGQQSVVFYRLPFRSPCKVRGTTLDVQSLAYNPRDNRLYIVVSRRNDGYDFYGIRSVPVNDLRKKSPKSVRFYYLQAKFTHGHHEPEGISFDRRGNMYLLLRHPEAIYRVAAHWF